MEDFMKIKITQIISIMLLVFLTSCTNPLSIFQSENNSFGSSGMLMVEIESQNTSRTLTPDFEGDIDHYTISGEGPYDTTLSEQTLASDEPVQDLEVGAWSFTIKGKDENNTTLALGKKSKEISTGENTLTINVAYLQSGVGSVKVNLSWPEDSGVNKVIAELGENDPVDLFDGTAACTYTVSDIDSGDYVLRFTLQDDSTLKAIVEEVVHVYDNQVTTADITLYDSDLSSPPELPENLKAELTPDEKVKLTWFDAFVRTETGFIIQRDTSDSFDTPTELVVTDANVSSYTDTAVTAGQTYYYRITSRNIFGNNGWTDPVSQHVPTYGEMKWAFESFYFSPLYKSPAIGSDGTIYFGDQNDRFYAISPDGTIDWAFLTNGDTDDSPVIDPEGPLYTSIYSDTIFALERDGDNAGTELFSIDGPDKSPVIDQYGNTYFMENTVLKSYTREGTERWTFELSASETDQMAISADGDTIYVGTSHSSGALRAIASDGSQQKWTFDTSVYSDLAIDNHGTIYFAGFSSLYAVYPDGTQKWTKDLPDDINATPVIGSDGSIYIGCDDGNFYSLDQDGNINWSFSAGSSITNSAAIANNGNIYFTASDGFLYAVNSSGEQVWCCDNAGDFYTSPTIGPDGTIYAVSEDGHLYAIKGASTGPALDAPWPLLNQNPQHTGQARSTIRKLTITSATLNSAVQSVRNPSFTVSAGQSLTGSVSVDFEHNVPETHVLPLAVTPDWGDKQSVYWEAEADMINGGSYTADISLTAPSTTGTYHIIFATQSEYSADQIVSATSYHDSSVTWNDGNDLFDLTDTQLSSAQSNGFLLLPRLKDGIYTDQVYGISAVELIVE